MQTIEKRPRGSRWLDQQESISCRRIRGCDAALKGSSRPQDAADQSVAQLHEARPGEFSNALPSTQMLVPWTLDQHQHCNCIQTYSS